MSVIYKVIKMKANPQKKDSPIRYYPRIVTMGKTASFKFIINRIKDSSSLSRGDILSVVQNFVEKLKEQLLEGKTVSVDGLGVFSLSLRSSGEPNESEVGLKTVRSIRICFRPDKELRIEAKSTRVEGSIHLISLEDYLKTLKIDPESIKPNGKTKPPKKDEDIEM